jgi:hypothetical protein
MSAVMATRRIDYPIEPMTLGNMRHNGVRSLFVSCWQCHHRAIMSADRWPDHVPVPTERDGVHKVRDDRRRCPTELEGTWLARFDAEKGRAPRWGAMNRSSS